MFLLVPAHPGCPGQNPESRKTVVVVIVVYSVTKAKCEVWAVAMVEMVWWGLLKTHKK